MGAPLLLTVGVGDNETVETKALIATSINLHLCSLSSWDEYESAQENMSAPSAIAHFI
jgi:hypothetical protein